MSNIQENLDQCGRHTLLFDIPIEPVNCLQSSIPHTPEKPHLPPFFETRYTELAILGKGILLYTILLLIF